MDPQERARMDAWLAAKEHDLFAHMVYVGAGVTISDTVRWMRALKDDLARLDTEVA